MEKIISRFYRSIPLIPVFAGLFVFIAALSPMTWSIPGFALSVFGSAIGLGVICAYSTTIFMDELKR